MTFDYKKIKEEIVVFIRNQDILTTSQRGVTTTTDEFNGDGNQTVFNLTQTNPKNVRSVTVGGVSQTYGTDYEVDYYNAQVTFTSAPGSGTNNVDIQYDYGEDKIYPDWPRLELGLNSYPRIGLDYLSGESSEQGLNADIVLVNPVVQVGVFADKGADVDDYHKDIRSAIINNKKSFYRFKLISPVGIGVMINEEGRHNKILSRTTDYRLYNVVEE